MLTELGEKLDKHRENFNKAPENIKKEAVGAEEYNN